MEKSVLSENTSSPRMLDLTLSDYELYTYFMSNFSRVNWQSVVWREGKHYVSQCLNVDVSSFGKTKREALANLDEAVALYLEDASASQVSQVKRPEVVPL